MTFKKIFIAIFCLCLISSAIFIKVNDWKFYSLYFQYKYDLTQEYIEKKILDQLNNLMKEKLFLKKINLII